MTWLIPFVSQITFENGTRLFQNMLKMMEALMLLNLVPQTFHSWPFDESSEMIEHACVFKLNSMSMLSLGYF